MARRLKTHMAFIDLRKAYDSVPRKNIWKAFEGMHINPTLIKIVQEFYSKNQIYIKQRTLESPLITSTKGLR